MKRLFDENDRYTDEAFLVVREAYSIISPLVRSYKEKGYSMRDIMLILVGEVEAICLENMN